GERAGRGDAGVVEAVAGAGAVVLATPVYRGSMTGALKNLLDLLPVSALEGKAVGLAAMGASDHHFLGADRHLRDVLAFVGAVVAPVSVYLTSADFGDGAPGRRAEDALDELLAGVVAISRALDGVGLGPRPPAARTAPPG
ncbi:MAG: NADPH-dependent FMN reductase, partial [Solirubrobacterales bacterium]